MEMSNKFQVEMFPATNGDCFWVSYEKKGQNHNILIDGGTAGTFKEIRKKILSLSPDHQYIDLLVITHIDNDHIAGILKIFEDSELQNITFGDIWFNGWRHLPSSGYEEFGVRQGERLSSYIDSHSFPWNSLFKKLAVSINTSGSLPIINLDDDMKITLLSPYAEHLVNLQPIWREECKNAGLDPSEPPPEPKMYYGYERFGPIDVDELAKTKFISDKKEANGSSIAFLMEFKDKRILFAGDAFPDVLAKSIQVILDERNINKLNLDMFKVPHHGSKANINKNLISKVKCSRYLFSTNGTTHGHPNAEAIARVLKHGKHGNFPTELVFNYKTLYNRIWDNQGLKDTYNYYVWFPKSGKHHTLRL